MATCEKNLMPTEFNKRLQCSCIQCIVAACVFCVCNRYRKQQKRNKHITTSICATFVVRVAIACPYSSVWFDELLIATCVNRTQQQCLLICKQGVDAKNENANANKIRNYFVGRWYVPVHDTIGFGLKLLLLIFGFGYFEHCVTNTKEDCTN